MPPGAASSGDRTPAHPAAAAYDGDTATYWQSKSPASGQWLSYTFPTPQTVLQYSLRRGRGARRAARGFAATRSLRCAFVISLRSGSSDARWLAADGLTAFELQGSADGVKWSYVDRRCARARDAAPLPPPVDTRARRDTAPLCACFVPRAG